MNTDLARLLRQQGALRFGQRSVQLHLNSLAQPWLDEIGDALYRLACSQALTARPVKDVGLGGQSVAEAYCFKGQQPAMSDGDWKPGENIVLIGDLAARKQTKLITDTVMAIRARGFSVTDCLVVLDTQQDTSAALAVAGCRLHALFTKTELLRILATPAFSS